MGLWPVEAASGAAPIRSKQTMPSLSDLHAVLLTHAAQRDSGSLLPFPENLADNKPTRIPIAIKALVKRGFACEQETMIKASVYRTDGDLQFGAFITPAGLAAINIGEDESAVRNEQAPASEPKPATSKRETVLALLHRESGVTLAELIQATSWLPHTTRAALTGLRKKGHCIERSKRGNVSCYRIEVAA
jgi:hypothetical protein